MLTRSQSHPRSPCIHKDRDAGRNAKDRGPKVVTKREAGGAQRVVKQREGARGAAAQQQHQLPAILAQRRLERAPRRPRGGGALDRGAEQVAAELECEGLAHDAGSPDERERAPKAEERAGGDGQDRGRDEADWRAAAAAGVGRRGVCQRVAAAPTRATGGTGVGLAAAVEPQLPAADSRAAIATAGNNERCTQSHTCAQHVDGHEQHGAARAVGIHPVDQRVEVRSVGDAHS